MIYFIQPVDGGPIKIGTTENLEARLSGLESYYGCRMALLATMPGDRDREQEIHAMFRHLRLGRTEQFQPARELLDFIGKPLLVAANPETVEAIEPVKVTLCSFNGSPAFVEWFNGLLEHCRAEIGWSGLPPSHVIERALRCLAKQMGFTEEAPRR